jgi:hypothetical protein
MLHFAVFNKEKNVNIQFVWTVKQFKNSTDCYIGKSDAFTHIGYIMYVL